jgi:twinfilin
MLYSSSREDLKRSLGLGYFKAEYSANSKADILWTTLQQFLNRDAEKLYSAAELAIQYEKKETHAETRSSKSAAMGLLPINISEGVPQDLQEFAAAMCNFIEICVADETLKILAKSQINPGSSFREYINESQVRFYLVRSSGSVTFMYSCPENAPIKMKMQGSSFKATVNSIIKENGITIDKTIENRDRNDLEDTLTVIDASPISSATVLEASTKAATVSSPRPSRPGRPATNKGKASKFVGDGDLEESV